MATYTINLPDKVLRDVDIFANRNKITRDEAIQRAFALLAIANEASKKHQKLCIIDDTSEIIFEITGA